MPRCSQTACRINETGVCLDGYSTNCPHLIPDNITDDSQQEVTSPVPVERPEPVRFHTGEKFTIAEASTLLNHRPVNVVLCVGSQGSGKTTFLARIGEMFRSGSFAHFRFAGSHTLCAFERVTWRATITSGVPRPDTRRTERRENDTFYHLQVQPKTPSDETHEILISDLAGETFSTAVASREFCSNLYSLDRADHLVVFLDCAKLANQAQRHAEMDNAREFMQKVCEIMHNPHSLNVQVLFSRWDYVTEAANSAEVEKHCDDIQNLFQKRFALLFSSLTFRRIAARPANGNAPTNGEIQATFASWLQTPPEDRSATRRPKFKTIRDFCAYGIK